MNHPILKLFLVPIILITGCEPEPCDIKDIVSPRCNAKKTYNFSNEPIDVVLVTHPKDSQTLDLAIKGIKTNGENIRNIFIVSSQELTTKAIFFNESLFPFTKKSLALEIFGGNEEKADSYIHKSGSRIGWVYQQLLKLYAPLIIPGISSNVLILDSDTMFLKEVKFMDSKGNPFFNPGSEYHKPYFAHASRLLPGLAKLFPNYSGIAHHMLFQRAVLDDLFNSIKTIHNEIEPWKAIARSIDTDELDGSSMSEYEIYFNYVFSRTNQAQIRHLQYKNERFDKNIITRNKNQGNHYVSAHAYL